MSRARQWARRAALSALAGSGLTAAGVGGPLAGGGALAAEAPAGAAPGQPPTSTTSSGSGGEQTATTPTASTATPALSSTPAPSSAAPAPVPTATTKQPATQQPAGEGPEGRAPANHTPESAKHAPVVAHQHKQPASTGGTVGPQLPPPPMVARPGAPAVVPSANIAPAPQVAAGQLAPSGLLSGSLVSMQALGFYRIPLFLLPIYQAAANQYGVPWQILAAINEVETDYGTDLSVSSAGAVGWMQFMPETWLQYGVDAVNAGYADPYNPVDAIFAAARYLHAAGASSDLKAAILAYNHSEAYEQSVLLRARLIASYPASVIATLTGLTEGSLPAAAARLAAAAPPAGPAENGASNATGQAVPAGLPGSTSAPAPAVSAARAEALANAPAPPSELSKLVAAPNAPVVAVEDGRIVNMGRSRKLGNFLVLRDTYGDVFTYAGLGSIVPSFHLPKPAPLRMLQGSSHEGASQSGKALTLHVATRQAAKNTPSTRSIQVPAPVAPAEGVTGGGKVRVFAHPGNPDAVAAIRAAAARAATPPPGWSALTRGALVAQGTVLGRLTVPSQTPPVGYMRFAIRPSGSQSAIDPAPVLANWRQLDAALHPQGAHAGAVLAGATAADAFLLGGPELERAVLADPRIKLSVCDRHQVAAGRVDSRALALLVFLSRSGLGATVAELDCRPIGASAHAASAHAAAAHAAALRRGPGVVKITAINGVPIAGHQGAGTISDIAIRTLLTAKHGFAPAKIVSLMQYPGVPSTVASADHAAYLELRLARLAPSGAAHGGAHARTTAVHTTAVSANVTLDSGQWRQLISHIGALPQPKIAHRPSGAAIHD